MTVVEERSTHAGAEEQMTGNRKIYTGEDLPNLELRADTLRGWIVPVGGSTPDRLKDDRSRVTGTPRSATLSGADPPPRLAFE